MAIKYRFSSEVGSSWPFFAVLEKRIQYAYEIGDQFPVCEFPNALRCNFSVNFSPIQLGIVVFS